MKIVKVYSKKDVREIAKARKLPLPLYLQSLVNKFVVLYPRQDGSYTPDFIGGTKDPIFYSSIIEAKSVFDAETDIIMSAYNYIRLTCGLSI